jgi:hypothetical protein
MIRASLVIGPSKLTGSQRLSGVGGNTVCRCTQVLVWGFFDREIHTAALLLVAAGTSLAPAPPPPDAGGTAMQKSRIVNFRVGHGATENGP